MWGFGDYLDDVEEFTDEDDNVVGPVPFEWVGHINLEIANVTLSDPEPYPWQFVNATVTVKNTGTEPAYNVWVDYYINQTTAPLPGARGNSVITIHHLGGRLRQLDHEPDDGDRVREAHQLVPRRHGRSRGRVERNRQPERPALHRFPDPAGGRVAARRRRAVPFVPAIAELDGDPTNLEVVIGCDDHKVYAWRHDGTAVPGWPVTLPDSVVSSPAVGDVTGTAAARSSSGATTAGCTPSPARARYCGIT